MRSWFLAEIRNLRTLLFKEIKTLAKKYSVRSVDLLFLLGESNLWPSMSPGVERAVSLLQEILLWTRVPDLKKVDINDVSIIKPVILELGMTAWGRLFPKLEQRFERKIESLAIGQGLSFLDVMEIFERGLNSDRFMHREIILGIVASQFR